MSTQIPAVNLDIYEEPKEKPPYPLEASSWGTNSFWHRCDHTEQSRNFSLCVMVMSMVQDGKKCRPGYEDCWKAVEQGSCPAIAMRQEEVAAGQSLYYLPRLKVKAVEPLTKRSRPATFSSMMKQTSEPAPDPKPAVKKPQGIVSLDMSEVVNDLMKEEVAAKSKPARSEAAKPARPPKEKKAEDKPVTQQPIKRLPGETPLQFVRRKKAALAA